METSSIVAAKVLASAQPGNLERDASASALRLLRMAFRFAAGTTKITCFRKYSVVTGFCLFSIIRVTSWSEDMR
jgi:hypothetical protein